MKQASQFQQGINFALSSFNFLWHHTLLLIYFIIPAIISIIGELFIYNLLVTTDKHMPPLLSELDEVALFITHAPGWLQYVGILITLFISLFIINFFNAGLIHQVLHLLKKEPTSIKESIQSVTLTIPALLSWSAIYMVIIIVLQKLQFFITSDTSLQVSLGIGFIALIGGIAWSLLTLFVVPVIALERKNVLESIKKSWEILKKYFLLAITGHIFIGFLAFIIVALLILPRMMIANTSYLLVFISFMLIIARCVISTTHSIFKTMVYHLFIGSENKSPCAWHALFKRG